MAIEISEARPDDRDAVMALWSDTAANADDAQKQAVAQFLRRHPGLTLVAREGEQVIGAVLCHFAGDQGYLQHMAIAPDHRDGDLPRKLIDKALAKLAANGIRKCRLHVGDEAADHGFFDAARWAALDEDRDDPASPAQTSAA